MAIAVPIPEIGAPLALNAASPGLHSASADPDILLPQTRLQDKFQRSITDLRVSVTDRCNYKCIYCRTGQSGAQYPDLPIADYLEMIRAFVDLGIEKIRLTGGEPLLRKGIVELVRKLSPMRTAFGGDGLRLPAESGRPLDLALTTNGHLLADMAEPLRDAGLNRVTVSMDAVDSETFARITRVQGSFQQVLAGIRTAKRAGLDPVKVNCVLLRGFNDDQIVNFAKFSRDEGVVIRFIEFMPLDEGRIWSPDIVVPMAEIVAKLNTFRPLVPLPATASGETAVRFTFDDGIGEIGIIAPVTRPFCGHCSRVRLTSDGKIRTCLFSQADHDLHAVLRRVPKESDSLPELKAFIRRTVAKKEARHHIGEQGFLKPSRSMVHIGG